jgi:hypothetical protein
MKQLVCAAVQDASPVKQVNWERQDGVTKRQQIHCRKNHEPGFF